MATKLQTKKTKTSAQVANYAVVLLAGIFQAVGIYVFILPNKFSPGGVGGIATAIEYLTGLNTGYMNFALNAPLVITAWFVFKRDYVIKTAVAIAVSSVLLVLLPLVAERLPVLVPSASNEPIVAAIAGGVLSGMSAGILAKVGGSNGGSEIMGGFIQRKAPEYNMAWFIFVFDSAVVIITAFIIDTSEIALSRLDIVILSIIKMFCMSMVCSTLLEGFSSALKFEIITKHPDELGKEIISELGRGVTRMTAQGVYSGKENFVLICVVRKKQIGAFQRILKKYPDTFAYIMNTKEVYGRGFSVSSTESAVAEAAIPAISATPADTTTDSSENIAK